MKPFSKSVTSVLKLMYNPKETYHSKSHWVKLIWIVQNNQTVIDTIKNLEPKHFQ